MSLAAHPEPGSAAGPAAHPAIRAQSVSKAFALPHEKYTTVKQQLLHPLSRHSTEVLHALSDVSLQVSAGEFFGIVGRNGSGKSTLLKCLSGIYRIDTGEVALAGRVAPFIELGVGFNPELSARDNALINAILLGLTPAEARERLDEMLAFAELTQFRDMKVKNFSSGMTLRLAFAVTVQVDADILMLDEVLSVGDSSFQSKCMEHFDRLRAEGRTMVLVTHDMGQIERLCDRALLLENGRIAHIGSGAEVAEAYDAVNADAAAGRELPRRQRQQVRRFAPSTPRPAVGPLVPSRGPTLLGDDPRRLPTLILTLAKAEFRLRYLDAALSYLWVLMGPLLFSTILYFVFKVLGSFGKDVPHYPLYLLSSLLLWTFFAVGTYTAVSCLVDREPLLRRLAFPRIAIPLSVVMIALFDLAMSLVALLVFVLASGVEPRLTWLELPALIAAETVLTTGVSLLLAAVYVRYRDVDQIWILLRQLMFYASGIFFVVNRVPHGLRVIFLSNPMAALFVQTRHVLIDPHAPTLVQAAGSVPAALIPLALTLIALAAGIFAFARIAPTAAEEL